MNTRSFVRWGIELRLTMIRRWPSVKILSTFDESTFDRLEDGEGADSSGFGEGLSELCESVCAVIVRG